MTLADHPYRGNRSQDTCWDLDAKGVMCRRPIEEHPPAEPDPVDENPIVVHMAWRDGGEVNGRQEFAVWYARKIREAKHAGYEHGYMAGSPLRMPPQQNPYERP